MTYHWPTTEGWITVGCLCVLAAGMGGWYGFGLMMGFIVLISVLGNILLP